MLTSNPLKKMPEPKNLPPIVLASASPRRQELMQSLGVPFITVPSDVDESAFGLETQPPQEQVLVLSREKAAAVAIQYPDSLVIGSDTLVALAGPDQQERVLGKPSDQAEAFEMLNALQGRMHTVYSAITLIYGNERVSDVLSTRVWMKPLSEGEIHRYIKTGEPMDKAGSYAIQGVGSLFIERIDGCYFNVMGMSMYLLNQLFSRVGVSILQP